MKMLKMLKMLCFISFALQALSAVCAEPIKRKVSHYVAPDGGVITYSRLLRDGHEFSPTISIGDVVLDGFEKCRDMKGVGRFLVPEKLSDNTREWACHGFTYRILEHHQEIADEYGEVFIVSISENNTNKGITRFVYSPIKGVIAFEYSYTKTSEKLTYILNSNSGIASSR